ncbi:MAG TPA: hypothetical protein VFO86_15190 [Terriglobia bacterium]|nr:hypothetical protein [Terriglobia bacterium]
MPNSTFEIILWSISWVFLAVGFAFDVIALLKDNKDLRQVARILFAGFWWIEAFESSYKHKYVWMTFSVILAMVYTYLWWKNRRKGRFDKIKKLVGEKSKVLVDKLVEKMPQPKPVGALNACCPPRVA